MKQTARYFNRLVDLISQVIDKVAGYILVVMMFLTATDVLLRYVFNRPISGSFELTEYMMLIVVAFSIAYCAVLKGHVRVELLFERFPQRAQAIINSFIYLLGLGLFSLLTWQCIIYMNITFSSKLTSSVLLIPVFPFVGLLVLGIGMYWFTLLVDFIKSVAQAVKQ
ncbi:TRAP transporter small permease subunit [Chloroflexota bacterium]